MKILRDETYIDSIVSKIASHFNLVSWIFFSWVLVHHFLLQVKTDCCLRKSNSLNYFTYFYWSRNIPATLCLKFSFKFQGLNEGKIQIYRHQSTLRKTCIVIFIIINICIQIFYMFIKSSIYSCDIKNISLKSAKERLRERAQSRIDIQKVLWKFEEWFMKLITLL